MGITDQVFAWIVVLAVPVVIIVCVSIVSDRVRCWVLMCLLFWSEYARLGIQARLLELKIKRIEKRHEERLQIDVFQAQIAARKQRLAQLAFKDPDAFLKS